ncbi:MAG: flagellar hook-length control protein FliK [Burkholderiales bacterium]|nr:flagellar hook-length control protein FliK [Burkholderiales bacterium]
MDTPALTPQTSARPAGNTAATDTAQTDATAAGFAALLALELAPTADSADEPGLSAEDIDVQTEDSAAGPSFAADPLASLHLPAVAPASAAHNRGGARSIADLPAETATRTDATQAKSAAGGNSPLPAALAGDHGPDAALPDQSVAAQELPAQPLGGWQAAPLSPQTPATTATSVTLPRIEVPVSQTGWSEAFAQRVLLLAGKQQQSAELHLNPPDLGPVSIVLSMDNDLANVFFSSPLVPVREAIENAMPTLREALGQAGIQLGEASVSSESFRSKADSREQPGSSAATGEAGETDSLNEGAERIPIRHPGLIDTFA